jgi:hypothetical protein
MNITRPVSSDPVGTGFSKFAICLAKAGGDVAHAREMAAALVSAPHVERALALTLARKAAVGPQHSEGFGGPLTGAGLA